MLKAGEAGEPCECEYIFGRCLEYAADESVDNRGIDYRGRYLTLSANVVTEPNRQAFKAAFDEYCEKCGYNDDLDMAELTAIRHLDGQEAARAFIEENIECDSFRLVAYDDAMDKRRLGKGNPALHGTRSGRVTKVRMGS